MGLGVPIAFLYNYGLFEITSAKLRMLCPMAFGALIGAICGGALYAGKVRNTTVAGWVGGAAASFALYLSWIAWVMHLFSPTRWFFNVSGFVLRPLALWKAVQAINATGTWGYEKNEPTTGAFLWLIWALEAVAVTGFGVLASYGLIKHFPFCERCNAWCKVRRAMYIDASLAPSQLKTLVESQDFKGLESLPAGDKKKAHFRVDLRSCGNCGSLNTLSLVQNLPRNKKTLVDKLLVTEDQASVFRNIEMKRSALGTIPASSLAK